MKKTLITVVTAAICAMSLAGSAAAKPALKDVGAVREGIIAIGMAYEITQNCGSIRPRYFRAIGYLKALKDHAKGLGYSDSEIDAYIGDKTEESRLKGIARGRLSDMGAVAGDEASYCTVGQAEIDKNDVVGQLMR